jgi:predicted Fe-Mo cluster-binding NifX family protein
MQVAITVWEDRLSPVLDAARSLMIATIKDSRVIARQRLVLPIGCIDRLVQLLIDQRVKVLICGAICRGGAERLSNHGIRVISFMTGNVEELLAAYVANRDLARYAMPGCGGRRCCRYARGIPDRRRRTAAITEKEE